MRELTIDEKAKAYDKKLSDAKHILGDSSISENDKFYIRNLFHELAESDDDRIKKDIVEAVELHKDFTQKRKEDIYAWLEEQSGNPYSGVSFTYNGNVWGMCARDNGVDISFNRELIQHVSTEKQSKNSVKIGETYKCIASPKYTCFRDGDFYYVDDNFVAELINICSDCFVLLENQGEHKPAEVKPKFHKDNWLVNVEDGNVVRVIDILEDNYRLKFDEDTIGTLCIEHIDDNYRLWTLADAKDGDVLADGDLPFIFKKIDANGYSYAYCGISVDDGFKIESDGEHGEWTWMQDIKPSTKEQRERLEKAIMEAGYRWNPYEKKLEKIEQKPWSEEDEKIKKVILEALMTDDAIKILVKNAIYYEGAEDWLKSIKNRVGCKANCTTTNEWSEEDEKILSDIIKDLVNPWNEYIPDRIEDEIKWLKNKLKSLRPQSTWSPSNEQIVALRWVLNHIPYNKHKEEISGLLDQIKGL